MGKHAAATGRGEIGRGQAVSIRDDLSDKSGSYRGGDEGNHNEKEATLPDPKEPIVARRGKKTRPNGDSREADILAYLKIELVQHGRTGDSGPYRILVERHWPSTVGVLTRILDGSDPCCSRWHDSESRRLQAEEYANQAFDQTFDKLGETDFTDSFRAYVRKAAKNIMTENMRKLGVWQRTKKKPENPQNQNSSESRGSRVIALDAGDLDQLAEASTDMGDTEERLLNTVRGERIWREQESGNAKKDFHAEFKQRVLKRSKRLPLTPEERILIDFLLTLSDLELYLVELRICGVKLKDMSHFTGKPLSTVARIDKDLRNKLKNFF
jgi:hypothetical protein